MSSLTYIYQDFINEKTCIPLFKAMYVLNENGPIFLPNFDINNDPNFYGIINSLLEDMVEMGLYMKRIVDDYPSYNVCTFVFTVARYEMSLNNLWYKKNILLIFTHYR